MKRIWLQEGFEHDTELKQGFLVVTLFLPFFTDVLFRIYYLIRIRSFSHNCLRKRGSFVENALTSMEMNKYGHVHSESGGFG
jgi:hypothetical protein